MKTAITNARVLDGQALRTVLGYTGADIVESACAKIPAHQGMLGADGIITDPGVHEQLSTVLRSLPEFCGPAAPTGR